VLQKDHRVWRQAKPGDLQAKKPLRGRKCGASADSYASAGCASLFRFDDGIAKSVSPGRLVDEMFPGRQLLVAIDFPQFVPMFLARLVQTEISRPFAQNFICSNSGAVVGTGAVRVSRIHVIC
jgi:hypothetical protein